MESSPTPVFRYNDQTRKVEVDVPESYTYDGGRCLKWAEDMGKPGLVDIRAKEGRSCSRWRARGHCLGGDRAERAEGVGREARDDKERAGYRKERDGYGGRRVNAFA